MGIETTPVYISDLNELWPLGADSRTTADDHMRIIKDVIKNTLAGSGGGGFTGAVSADHSDLNVMAGAAAASVLPADIQVLAGAAANSVTPTVLAILATVAAASLDGLTATDTELNVLDGFTGSTADLNLLSGQSPGLDADTLGGYTPANCLNSNLIPSGTKMLFRQTSAPSGWTKDTTNFNQHAVRIVTGTVSNGGSVDFTTAFSNQTVSGTSGNTTLTTNQIPSHQHQARHGAHANNDFYDASHAWGNNGSYNSATATWKNTGGGASHNHSFSDTVDLRVKYVDFILATKD